MFEDRRDAGRRLAKRLGSYRETDCVVVGLPRGGVVVADELAQALDLPLEVIVVRKLRAPADPELGIGAIVAGPAPEVALDEAAIASLGVLPEYLFDEVAAQLAEARLREALLREGCRPVPLAGRTVMVVDDGIATGCTMTAALIAARRARPGRVVLAVPVAAADALARFKGLVDEVVCLRAPRRFAAVGAYYRDFAEVSEGEVIALLARARGRMASEGAPVPLMTGASCGSVKCEGMHRWETARGRFADRPHGSRLGEPDVFVEPVRQRRV
jgi:putative phosphoribosyl transferase